ncbi:MAG: hypothetical protein IJ518_03735 [Clostridia bacterium]|nr:hypothetical protein [Clostridia bacterium]
MKKLSSLLLAAALLCGVLGLVGCSAPAYKVRVVDAMGNPYTTGVIVCFKQNGAQVAMQPIDETGVATKELDKGNYDVELMFTGDAADYYYEKEGLTLSADKMELDVVLSHAVAGEGQTLFAQSKEHKAYNVATGGTFVTLKPGERNYFLFTPTTAGTYEFSVKEAGTTIGYYGAPHYVQEASVAEVKDNAFTVSVNAGMIGGADASGTTVLVIGVDADANTTNCILRVQRIGDPAWSIADEPWSVYTAKTAPKAYTLPAGAKLAKFDVTAATDAYKLVLNDKDGFYHLNTADGPLVLMYLGEKGQYITDYKTILDKTGVVKYFYEGDTLTKENFEKKENYGTCLLQYIECMDEEAGVYPLTEDLKYILQQNGDHQGWWEKGSNGYLFKDADGNDVPGINAELAWLDICCYIEG